MWKNILERFKSPVVLTTLAALIAFVAKDWLGFEIPSWDKFVELLMAFMLAFGLLNNPENRKGF